MILFILDLFIMKLILLLISSILVNLVAAGPFTLPEKAFCVQVATGQFVELGQESGVRRFWDGENWHWENEPISHIHHFKDGKLVKVTEKEAAPLHYSYDKKGRLVRRESGPGHFLEIIYDKEGRVIEERAPLGKESSPVTCARFRYDKGFTEVFDPLGHKKIYHWNEKGSITSIDHYLEGALYRRERYIWEGDTLVKQTLENAQGVELASGTQPKPPLEPLPEDPSRALILDDKGRVVSQTTVQGQSENYSWDAHGNLISRITSTEGKEERFTYDFMNRLIRESEGFSFEYDWLGQEIKRIDPEGNETEFVYDDLGRLIKMIQPEVLGPQGTPARPVTQWRYDELDQMIEMIDPEGRVVIPKETEEEVVEPLDIPPSTLKEEDTILTKTIINDRGQRVLQKTFTDPRGLTFVRTLDALGRVEKLEKYDLVGKLYQTVEYRYTLTGLKTGEITDGHFVEWVWGQDGQLEALIEDKGGDKERITRLHYNEQGKLCTYLKPSGISLHYTYDKAGGLNTLISSDGTIHYQFIWGDKGRLKSVQDHVLGTVCHREYDEEGKLILETLSNGLTMRWEEERLILPDLSRIYYQPSEIIRENSQGDPLYSHRFSSFDPLGQLVEEELILNLGTRVIKRDQDERIISLSSPSRQEKITYQGMNLTEIEVNGEKTSYEYDEQFRLKRSPISSSMEFDRDGHVTKIHGHHLTYDALGRLIQVDDAYHYTYDPFGRRMSKKGSEGECLYFWDGMEEIGSASPEGTILELKITSPYGPVAVEILGIPYAAIKDHKGSIVELIGLSSPVTSPWGYLGKREDPETGFIYFGARFLDPESGRFLTPDPKGYADGPDLYQFAKDNPMAYSDLYGHWAFFDFFKSLLKQGWNALVRLNEKIHEFQGWFQNLAGIAYIEQKFEETLIVALGKGFLIQSGWYRQAGQTGIIGEKEMSPHIRVTFNHGILNLKDHLYDNIRQVCKSHGGANIHYVFRPTQGIGLDVIKCLMVKAGYVSPEAKELIRIWKGLIEEMGGVNGGGKIIHYTHSIGGGDTWVAINHLSPEEQKMFDIHTFGSATLIPDLGTYRIQNYVSTNDAVSFFGGPVTYIKALFDSSPTSFLSSVWYRPIDHAFSSETYQRVLRALGQAFINTHGG